MRIAVCGRNVDERRSFLKLLIQCLDGEILHYDFEEYLWGTHLIDDIEEDCHFDVVFIDTNLSDQTGIDVIRKLRDIQFQGKIVITSDTAEYAIAGFELEALDYLLKPITKERLLITIKRLVGHYKDKLYRFRQRTKVVCIPRGEILYVESINSRCLLHKTNGISYTVYKRLDEIEDDLNDKRFLRCHQSYLVNMDYIMNVSKDFTLSTGDTIPIRQRELKLIRKKYLGYST